MVTIDEVISFWADDVGPKGWYEQNDSVDAEIRRRFGDAWRDAFEVSQEWAVDARGALAALILTDQFPRNMFRNDPRAYQTDPLARQIASRAIANGWDIETEMPMRQFFYMPFEHSEDTADQDRAVSLIADNIGSDTVAHAKLHQATIRSFGRFPWRNEALGRTSTPEEQALLDKGGYGALVRGDVVLEGAGEVV